MIQLHRQAFACVGMRLNAYRASTAEQPVEEVFARGQNCRLERADRLVGSLGTVPTPGSTNAGNTA